MGLKQMRNIFFICLLLIAGAFVLAASAAEKKDISTSPSPTPSIAPGMKVDLIEIDAPITPVVAEYIIKSIDRAARDKAEALIIQLNTPGGLLDATNTATTGSSSVTTRASRSRSISRDAPVPAWSSAAVSTAP